MWAKLGAASRNRALYRTLLFLFTIPVCRAVLVNRTIDSNLGDPVTGFIPIYQPQSPWADQTCSGCYIQPDIASAFDGTWNAATYHPGLQNVNITLQFTGVAVWIFFILSNANDHGTGTTTNTQVNITIDGQYAGNYSHNPDLSTHDLIYNATIFSATSLTNTSHELVIATNDYPIATFINFDWAIYSIDDGTSASQSISSSAIPSTTISFSADNTSSSTSTPTPQNSSSKTAVIVGCTVGGLALIGLVLVFFLRRKLRRAPLIQNTNSKSEGILDIDIPPRKPLYGKSQTYRRNPPTPSALSASEYTYYPPSSSSTWSPVPDRSLEQRNAARLRETRQREIDERIQSAQREMDNLKSVRNIRSASDVSRPSAGPSRSIPEVASLRNELQQLKDQIGHLQAQRQSDWGQGLSNEPQLPPAYTRH